MITIQYFDKLEGSEKDIRVFKTPVFDYFMEEMRYRYGSNTQYKIGDKVPYRTWWYNYTPDFTIVDGNDIFVFNNGIYEWHDVYDFSKIDTYKKAFGSNRVVINNEEQQYLDISDRYDLESYMHNQRVYSEFRAKVYEVAERISSDDLTELVELALYNSYQGIDVNRFQNYAYENREAHTRRNIGAYLWLAKHSEDDVLLKRAREYICRDIDLHNFDIPITERAEAYRAWEKIII